MAAQVKFRGWLGQQLLLSNHRGGSVEKGQPFLRAAVHQQGRTAPERCQELFVRLHRVGDLEKPFTQRNRLSHFSCRQQRAVRFDQ